MEKRYQVFVSSTYVDLMLERQKIVQALMEMDCIPAGMELFPAVDEDQWEFIKRVIDDCDYYILIIGGRYGSLTSEGISFTEKEYDYALSKSIKVLAFVHGKPDEIPVGKSDIDPVIREKLAKFREKVSSGRLVKFWSEAAELPGLVALSLQKTIKIFPSLGWVRGGTVPSAEVLNDLNELRKENSRLTAIVTASAAETTMDLAGLDEKIELTMDWTEYSKYGNSEKSGKIALTWSQIFGAIAPDLQGHPTDKLVSLRIGPTLWSVAQPDSTKSVKLRHHDFQTIKIHLEALGLTEVAYTNTIGGGADLFWSLTPKGKRTMAQLRAVKTSKS